MLRLVGSDTLTAEAASFYLDMSGWNVQTAVGQYFALTSGSTNRHK